MIRVFFGANGFELERALAAAVAKSGQEPEKLDGERLTRADLPGIFSGASLFASERLIIIRYLSDSADAWNALLGYDHADNEVILVEHGLDKRTAVYKHLQKVAELREFAELDARNAWQLEKWASDEAAATGVKLHKKVVQHLVQRVGASQAALASSIEKLALAGGEIDEARVDELIETTAEQNVFGIFEDALSGKIGLVLARLAELEQTEDAYRLFGLLTSQAMNLAALATSGKSAQETASDIGASPYALSSLENLAHRLGKDKSLSIICKFARADEQMKTTSLEPWLVVKNLLVQIAAI